MRCSCDSDMDSNRAMPTACETPKTQTLRNKVPVVRNRSWKCQNKGNFTFTMRNRQRSTVAKHATKLSKSYLRASFWRNGFFLLIFVGKSAQRNPPGKSPAKSSKSHTTKITDTFLQRGQANISCMKLCPTRDRNLQFGVPSP